MIKRILSSLFRRRCKHVFRGCDMGNRGPDGLLRWKCSKCGEEFVFEYGLQAMDHGRITGPWGVASARGEEVEDD